MNEEVTECASLPERPTSIEDFVFLKPISRGAFGKVFLGHKKNQEKKYAIKVMKKSDMVNKNLVSQVLAERDALVLSNSPFIVHLFYSLQSQNNVFLIMEYLIGGDVKSLLAVYGYFDEDMSRVYAAEVTLALRYLHSHGIIHRDLKPDNMLITCKGHLKLTDFGLSKINLEGGSISSDSLKTPLPYSKMTANRRTPGQILSLKSNLGFNLQSLNKHKMSSLLEESESQKSFGSIRSLKSPIGQSSAKPMSLRDRVVSQGTFARLTPPVRSLTPTLQDSLNWSQSNPSESGPIQIESTRLSSNYSHRHSLPMLKLSGIEENSKGLSISYEESVFDSCQSRDLSVSERSSYSVFDPSGLRHHGCHADAISDQCGSGHHGCCGKCCNSHLKVPSRQESLLDDTPQMHRTDESVWNSYAARNLRSMRYGSYSEDSEEENEVLGHQRDRRELLRHNNSIKKIKTLESKKRGSKMSRGGSCSYHSDEEISFNTNNVKKNLDRKRKFCLLDRSPALKQMYPRNSGLTQNIQVFSMFGDEHRLKRQQTEDPECLVKTGGQSATGQLVYGVEYSDVLVPPLDQTKNGDQTGEESLLMMSGIDHINTSDLSDNSPEGKEIKSKVKEERPGTKDIQVHFLSHVSTDNFPSCTASVPATPESESGQPKRGGFQTPSTPVSGRKIFHTGTPFILKTPAGQNVGTPAVHRTPVTRKTPFRTPRSVRRGRPLNEDDDRILGTPDYLAPEILLQKSHDAAVDWWALGVCLFEFLTGVPPFNDQTPDLVFQNILNRDIPWPGDDEEPLSVAAKSAIDTLLTMEPTDRPRDKEVQKLDFFEGVDWECLLEVEPPFIPQPDDDEDTTYFEARNSQQQLMVSGIDL